MRGSHRQRSAVALLTAILWLLAVEVLPNLHLAAHDADHTHGAAGTIVTVTFAAHDHVPGAAAHDHGEAAVHTHAAPAGHDRMAPGVLAIDAPAARHDPAGVGHHALALQVAAPLALPQFTLRPLRWEPCAVEAELRSIARVHAVARGPPASAGPAYSIESRHLRRAA